MPSPGGLPDSGIKPTSLAWQADSLPPEPPGNALELTGDRRDAEGEERTSEGHIPWGRRRDQRRRMQGCCRRQRVKQTAGSTKNFLAKELRKTIKGLHKKRRTCSGSHFLSCFTSVLFKAVLSMQ